MNPEKNKIRCEWKIEMNNWTHDRNREKKDCNAWNCLECVASEDYYGPGTFM